MATPRKHWFKVADSIADEDWSNDVLATLIRLQARMNTRWARNGLSPEEAATITLTAGDVMTVTRRGRVDRGITLVRECQRAVTMMVQVDAKSVTICWPKWPEFQGLLSRELPESRPLLDSDSDAPARRKTQKGRKRAPSAPPAPRSCVCPDELSPHEFGLLDDWATSKGMTVSQCDYAWARVRDWSRSKSLKRTDWLATLRNAMTDGWALKGYGQNPGGEPESAAQAKARRTKEAAGKAYEMVMARKQQLGLKEIEGGQS